jgi:hypothetical protein
LFGPGGSTGGLELLSKWFGAHLYGFPSPDSDFDLRAAHVLPIEKIVGLDIRDKTVEQEINVPPDTHAQGGTRHSVRADPGNPAIRWQWDWRICTRLIAACWNIHIRARGTFDLQVPTAPVQARLVYSNRTNPARNLWLYGWLQSSVQAQLASIPSRSRQTGQAPLAPAVLLFTINVFAEW